MEKWSLVRTCVVLGCLRIALGTIIDPERDTEQTSGLPDRVFAEVDIPPDCSLHLKTFHESLPYGFLLSKHGNLSLL